MKISRKVVDERVIHTVFLGEEQAGMLILKRGEVEWVGVSQRFRRKGIATLLWEAAKDAGDKPRHSACRYPQGTAWALAVGGYLPPLHSLPCGTCGITEDGLH